MCRVPVVLCVFFFETPCCVVLPAFAVWLCDLELDVIVEDFGVC